MDLGGRRFNSCEKREPVYGKWRVTNSTTTGDKVVGMYEAAQKSINTYFAQLVLDVGLCATTKMAEKLGVKLGTKGRELVDYQHIPAFTLGSAGEQASMARGRHLRGAWHPRDPTISQVSTAKEGTADRQGKPRG